MYRFQRAIEAIIFNSRWLVAPFLLGLIIGLAALLYKFAFKLADFVVELQTTDPNTAIVGLLRLVDLTLIANLIIIVICSSYENFLSSIDHEAHPNWPNGLIRIGFAGLKQRLLGSIVAIASVSVLEWFIDIDDNADNKKLAWVVGILLAFAFALLMLAIADRVSGEQQNH
jgi:uncharacterized protein (TIGR00645 family)